MQSTANQELDDINLFNELISHYHIIKHTIADYNNLIIKLTAESYNYLNTIEVFDKVCNLIQVRDAIQILYNNFSAIINRLTTIDKLVYNHYYCNHESVSSVAYLIGKSTEVVKRRINHIYNLLYRNLYNSQYIPTMRLILK